MPELSDISITSNLLWIVFLVALVAFDLVSVILTYHWKHYGYNPNTTALVKGVYFILGGILLAVMLVSLLMATKSFSL